MTKVYQTVKFVANMQILVHFFTKPVFGRFRCNMQRYFCSLTIYIKQMKCLYLRRHTDLLTCDLSQSHWPDILPQWADIVPILAHHEIMCYIMSQQHSAYNKYINPFKLPCYRQSR